MQNEGLVQLYQQGDKQALNELVEQNKGIVYKLANKFYTDKTNSIDIEDLQQEGFIGLITAANKYKFDIEHPCKFITYAVYRVYQRMSSFINARNTNEEISINMPIGDSDKAELVDTIKDQDNSYENIEDKLYCKQLRKELEEVMNKYNTLTEREILKLHYGWDNNKCMILKEIALVLGINPCSVRGIEYRAIGKLRRTVWGRKKADEYYKDRFSDCNYSIDEKIKALDYKQKYLRYRSVSDKFAINYKNDYMYY